MERCSANIYTGHGQAQKTGKSKRALMDPSYRPSTAVTTKKDKVDSQKIQDEPLRRSGRSREMNTDLSLQKVETYAAAEPAAQVALLEPRTPVKTTGTIATPLTEDIPRRAVDSNPPDKADNFVVAEMTSPREIVYDATCSIRILENYRS